MTISKYRAQPTMSHGIRFHSKREAARYAELLLLEKAGEISDLTLQPAFDLKVVGGFVKDIITTIGKYSADFRYFDYSSNTWVIEDVKSPPTKTPIYRWKVKHLKAQYGIEVKETA